MNLIFFSGSFILKVIININKVLCKSEKSEKSTKISKKSWFFISRSGTDTTQNYSILHGSGGSPIFFFNWHTLAEQQYAICKMKVFLQKKKYISFQLEVYCIYNIQFIWNILLVYQCNVMQIYLGQRLLCNIFFFWKNYFNIKTSNKIIRAKKLHFLIENKM